MGKPQTPQTARRRAARMVDGASANQAWGSAPDFETAVEAATEALYDADWWVTAVTKHRGFQHRLTRPGRRRIRTMSRALLQAADFLASLSYAFEEEA